MKKLATKKGQVEIFSQGNFLKLSKTLQSQPFSRLWHVSHIVLTMTHLGNEYFIFWMLVLLLVGSNQTIYGEFWIAHYQEKYAYNVMRKELRKSVEKTLCRDQLNKTKRWGEDRLLISASIITGHKIMRNVCFVLDSFYIYKIVYNKHLSITSLERKL